MCDFPLRKACLFRLSKGSICPAVWSASLYPLLLLTFGYLVNTSRRFVRRFCLSFRLARLCPLDDSLPDDAMIPGLAMFTTRAEPLATWMTGLEIAYFKVRDYRITRKLTHNVGRFS